MTSAEQLRRDAQAVVPVLASFLLILGLGAVVLAAWPQHLAWALLFGVAVGPFAGVLINFRNDSKRQEALETMASQANDPTDSKLAREDAKLYLDGKMQRYSLLFSVNGGVFAVVQILQPKHLLINIGTLSIGAAAFTVLMTMDIWLWGTGMRLQRKELFRPMGQLILLMIGALLFAGWFIAWTQRG